MPHPGLLARLAAGDWAGKLLRLCLVLGVSGTSALLLAPGDSRRLPGPQDLGAPAPATLKADRDYEIVDEEATARRRAEAAKGERTVWEHDVGAADSAAERIRSAFALMRAEESAFAGSTGNGGREASELERHAAQRSELGSRLKADLDDEDVAALEAAHFSEDAERELTRLVRIGLSGMVVSDDPLLAAERERGILVRTTRAGSHEGEKVLLDLGGVRSVAAARDDVQRAARARIERAPSSLAAALQRIALAMLRPTLVHDPLETIRRREGAAARVKPVVILVKRGEKILGDGERIEKRHLVVFDGMRAQRRGEDLVRVRLGGGALVALTVLLLWHFARRNLRRFRPGRRDALLLAALLVGTLAMGFLGFAVAEALQERFSAFSSRSLHYLVPFAAGAMLVRQVMTAETALLFGVAAGLGAGLLAAPSMTYALFATLTSLAAAGLPSGSRDRTGIFRSGLHVGLVGVAIAVAIGLHGGRGATDVAIAATAALVGGALLLPVVVVGVLPIVEGVFGYVTDVKLLELANLNHPALKELIVQAPGTYHHSILMGSLVEAAAQDIGANPLLAKVIAYYHDVGKLRNPLFFAENQRGENRHDPLAPSMSALIVKRHVTDGLELARQWRLPRVVQDAIAQHHGTRHVGYFWAKAQKAAVQGDRPVVLDESLFRYPGPKPQSREAAVVMIADACEASSRALDDPSGDALRLLVARRIDEIFGEGQLDECEITLRDLNAISGAMVRALEAIYHTRPEYPGRSQEPQQPPRPPVQLVARP